MNVFVTGASGFIGSAIVKDLIANGHTVLGLVRNPAAIAPLEASGAKAYLGDVNDPAVLQHGATTSDAVIHTAFNHDFTQFKANCEADRKVIETLGDALIGTHKPLVITSGMALLNYGRLVNEDEPVTITAEEMPRAASEEAALAVRAKGVKAYIVRLPPSVHGAGEYGFVPLLMNLAKEKNEAGYVNQGTNHWPAVHRFDAASLYRLIVEKQPEAKTFHAVAEQGIPFKQIAEAIGNGLNLPTTSKTGDHIAAYFGWFAHFASIDCLGSSEKTQQLLEWQPKEIGLIEDMKKNYF